MGNRRIDPYSRDLDAVCPSSPGWPEFTRIFPILDWQYNDIWLFLREFNLVYCKLYDDGYTSLGEQDNTIKNPHLKVSGSEEERYLPAYMLENEELERDSRVKK
jgi:3'-phosphoadenosine 5'-phosphosulfate sulfotransferase (PAPS reductase)/FAD synthetase